MPAEHQLTDDLLDPISTSQPAGADMRWTPEWDRIKEARRFDDALETGKWEKRERKTADWRQVRELATAMLRDRTKDLQLVMWLTEANTKMDGFTGLCDGLRLTRELMDKYWDKGLFPSMEDGAEDRVGPFDWLNNKLVDSIVAIPITARPDQGQNFSYIDLQDAKRVGSEAGCKTENGEIDPKKKKAYDQAIADGHISLEMFERAVRDTRRAACEELNLQFQRTLDEFRLLEKTVDEKFGDVANVSSCRTALSDMKQAIQDILVSKRKAEPDSLVSGATRAAEPAMGTDSLVLRLPLSLPNVQGNQSEANGSWREAESLVRSGQVEKGLLEMTRLAAGETCGRNRFERKLLLVEVCLGSDRERIARLVLEELAEQIDKFQLEFWESSELISSVWSRLYRIYKRSGADDDLERAGKLYERLCRLDPWQALGCEEG